MLCFSSIAGCYCRSGTKQHGTFQEASRSLSAHCEMSHLKTPHVSRVPCVLQAVLVTLEEELEEEPMHAKRDREREKRNKWVKKVKHELLRKNTNPSTNKTVAEVEACKLSHPHSSVVHDKGSFLSTNSCGILKKILPCRSISEP